MFEVVPHAHESSYKSMVGKLNGLQGNDFAKQYMDEQQIKKLTGHLWR
jgi:hypothetical protein